ncbi:hypothetical protein MVES_003162 [Malassezia vespertilionis]|uniref:ELYS-like domain-containing protein n=1 Tax=Malassezia vespertilionis TaxID=2020962 RepID=A0A2N1J897_9BASI|nr:hypothetical protein MVES_003162 [Malassezia vespertilionis]
MQASPEAQADAILLAYLSPPSDTVPRTWTAAYAADVRERRAKNALFPPVDGTQAYVLLVSILTAPCDDTTKHALVYYLAREHTAIQQRHNTADDTACLYAAQTRLAPWSEKETDGYWYMDHFYYPAAVPLLANASMLPLVAAALSDNLPKHAELLLQLYQVHGALVFSCTKTSSALVHFVKALTMVHGFGAAWEMCRSWLDTLPRDDALHTTLYNMLFRICFAPPDTDAIRTLMLLPLRPEETTRLEAFALAPDNLPQHHAALAVDTLLLKFVCQGRYVDAIHLDRRAAQLERTLAFAEIGTEAARLRARRKTLVAGLWAVLPQIQRDALRMDAGNEESTPVPIKGTPPRPQTPLSVSVSGSPEARILRNAIRAPSLGASVAGAPVEKVKNDPALRSSSPFRGWKNVAQPHIVQREPAWGVPVPRHVPLEDTKMDALPEIDPVHGEDLSMGEAGQDEACALDVHGSENASISQHPNAPMHEDPSPSRSPTPPSVPVRRKRGQRVAAKRAAEAIHDIEQTPNIPGGFPLWTEQESPRRSSRRGRHPSEDRLPEKSTVHRSRTGAHSPGRILRSQSSADVAYPHGTLARLEAVSDARPIARRTRAQTAELESHGSQASTEADGVSDADAAVPPKPRRRARNQSPAHRATRSSRRLRENAPRKR